MSCQCYLTLCFTKSVLTLDYFKAITIWMTYPLHLIAILLVVGLTLKALSRNKLSRWLNISALSLLLLCTQPYPANLLLYPLEHGIKKQRHETPSTRIPDLIYVLACNYDSESHHIPEVSRYPPCSLQRLAQAVILHKQYNAPILLTGGHFIGDEEVAYAQQAASFLQSMGVKETSIITKNYGHDTVTEITSVKDYLSGKRVNIVSSATHEYRVRMISRTLNIDMTFSPVDYLSHGELSPYLSWPSARPLLLFQRAFYEYLAIIKFAIFE